jgi:hypothetical protein
MSWSVTAIGRASAVQEKLNVEFGRIICPEPEETIKNHVREAVHTALKAFPPNHPVRVEASGSQSQPDSKAPEKTNQLIVKIEPIWGFVE